MSEQEEAQEQDDKHKAPMDQYRDVELGVMPMGPGAVPLAGPIGVSAAVPNATPETFVCLRGPCRHYWELETFMASGNPKETWDPETGLKHADGSPVRMPRQITRTCLVHPGTETEITDDLVHGCSKWDPLLPKETRAREKRIKKFLRIYPQFNKET